MPGGCPLMNTAIDADDGNAVLRKLALDAIADWKTRLTAIVLEGIRRREIRRGIDPGRIANTIIATLEGALMISRLEGSRTALRDAQRVAGGPAPGDRVSSRKNHRTGMTRKLSRGAAFRTTPPSPYNRERTLPQHSWRTHAENPTNPLLKRSSRLAKPDPRKADEDPVGKVYDSRLMRRLGRYLLPYWWQATVSSIAVTLKSLSDVSGPFLVMVGIDHYFPTGANTPRSNPRTRCGQHGSRTASAPTPCAASTQLAGDLSVSCRSRLTSSSSFRPT